jgi:hypothetical protein
MPSLSAARATLNASIESDFPGSRAAQQLPERSLARGRGQLPARGRGQRVDRPASMRPLVRVPIPITIMQSVPKA